MATATSPGGQWRTAAGMAAAIGIGRFAYTPILPAMIADSRLSPGQGAVVATANYLGYFLGALALTLNPRLNTTAALRISLVVMIISELAMAFAPGPVAFAFARLAAGVTGAVIFIACATAARSAGRGATGAVTFAGVGIGITLCGLLVAAGNARNLGWESLWLAAAVLTGILALACWPVEVPDAPPSRRSTRPRSHPARQSRPAGWWPLMASYTLEGTGYIIVGTFLVAATSPEDPGLAPLWWAAVGVSAAVSVPLWGRAVSGRSARGPLVAALAIQAAGALVIAAGEGRLAAVSGAVMFGGTFMGIVMLAVVRGVALGVPEAAAPLTAGFGLGQIFGPLVVIGVIGDSYATAFFLAAGIVALAAILAALPVRSPRGPTSAAPAAGN